MSHQASTPVLLAYLAASILFIVGLKMLSTPKRARYGNLVAAAGMIVAILATFFLPGLRITGLMITGLLLGTIGGIAGARWVRMTDMPQMVALLNGLGGGAAALVAVAEFFQKSRSFLRVEGGAVPEMVGAIIGSVAFSGSVIAFGKLQGIVTERAVTAMPLRVVHAAAGILMLISIGAVFMGGGTGWFTTLTLAALAFGVLMVMPIGGADMPVVVSILNSCTGLAAAAAGFVLHNNALIIAGTLVGASGSLLTQLMCKAMNRSLANVLFAGVGAGPVAGAAAATGASTRPVREVSSEDAAVLLSNIRSLIIVPGYGMAVAQAQHVVREMADMLGRRGVEVKYAIHPVAGRMPGHMNVLLAEANVPYDQLFDLEQINPDFERADVALVIGANDVVNPAARTDKGSPIYGMPILDADKAQHVIVVKRSLNPGFAGIDNPIYYEPRTMMLFGDAKSAIAKLVESLREAAA